MTPLRRLTKIKNVNSLKADGSSTMTNGRQTQSKTQNVTMPTTQNVTTQLGKSVVNEISGSDDRHSPVIFETEAVLKVDKSNQWPNNMYYTIEEHMAHRV